MLELTQQLVAAESPSDVKAAVDGCVGLVAARARALGGRVKLHRQRAFGDVLEARFGPKSRSGTGRAGSVAWASGYGLAAGNAEDNALPVERRAAVWARERWT